MSFKEEEGKLAFSSGNIPVLIVEGESLPEVWEKSLSQLWENGTAIKTQYDRPNDPPSRDATMIMTIKKPFAEPRIHRALPTGLDELEIYRQEVVLGVHDHWIGGHGWSYSYHDRLFNYSTGNESKTLNKNHIDQIEAVVENLSACFYTRRAQAITWDPGLDARHHEPPCLQRLWFRILEDPVEGLVLNMNTHWRSRDAFKAAFMNIYALTDLQKKIAERISENIKRKVSTGRYVDITDSYHIYGSYFVQFKGFLDTLQAKSFDERTFTTDFCEPFFEEARKKIAAE